MRGFLGCKPPSAGVKGAVLRPQWNMGAAVEKGTQGNATERTPVLRALAVKFWHPECVSVLAIGILISECKATVG